MKPQQPISTLACVLLACAPAPADELSDPAEPWTTAQAGITVDVPPPFEPLVVNGNQVSMWGRTLTLGNLLPAQIMNQDATVSHHAPLVVLAVGGERYELAVVDATVDCRRDVSAVPRLSVGVTEGTKNIGSDPLFSQLPAVPSSNHHGFFPDGGGVGVGRCGQG